MGSDPGAELVGAAGDGRQGAVPKKMVSHARGKRVAGADSVSYLHGESLVLSPLIFPDQEAAVFASRQAHQLQFESGE